MPLLPDQFDDFVIGTHKAVNKKSWTDLSLDLQHYTFPDMMSKGDKGVNVEATHRLEWVVQKTNTGSFEHSELFSRTKTVAKDLLDTAWVYWTKQLCSYMYDQDEDALQGDDPHKILSVLSPRIHSMYNDWFEGMEVAMWTAPTSSTQNPRVPSGIPFWVQKSDTAAFGFNGGAPSGFAAGAGNLLAAAVPNWANGTGTYATLTDDDGIDLIVKACEFCNFRAPHNFAELSGGKPRWGFYTVYGVVETLRKYLRNQNQSLGPDVAAYRGEVLLKGSPMIWVPALTNSVHEAYDSSNPIYGIDWKTMQWFFKKGRHKHITKPHTPEGAPTVREVYLINWGQFRCLNRRSNFVLTDSTT